MTVVATAWAPSFMRRQICYQKQYDSKTRMSALSKYFAGLTIVVSCLGLFGLAAFTAQKSRKEIAGEKVIGGVSNQHL